MFFTEMVVTVINSKILHEIEYVGMWKNSAENKRYRGRGAIALNFKLNFKLN